MASYVYRRGPSHMSGCQRGTAWSNVTLQSLESSCMDTDTRAIYVYAGASVARVSDLVIYPWATRR